MYEDTLYKRGDVWWCTVPNPGGGRRVKKTTGCRDRKAALVVWRELERQSVTPADQATNETPLGDILDGLLMHRRALGRAEGTLDFYDKKTRMLNHVLGAELPVSKLSRVMMLEYVQRRRAEGSTKNNISKELGTLGSAIKLDRQDPNSSCPPWERIRPLGFSADYQPKTRRLSELDIDAVASMLPKTRRRLFYFLCATGATYPSEVVHMVPKEDVRAAPTWQVHLRGTKRRTRDRIVPIVPFARAWFTKALAGPLPFPPWKNAHHDLGRACKRLSMCPACRNKKHAGGAPSTAELGALDSVILLQKLHRSGKYNAGSLAEELNRRGVPAAKGGKWWPASVRRALTMSVKVRPVVAEECAACAVTPVFPPLCPTDLRRSIGSLMRARGIAPSLIGRFLGHIDSRMAERVYGQISPEELGGLLADACRVTKMRRVA